MDRMDDRGGAIWLSREEWGVVTDALIEHKASALARKAGNVESTSDERATMCTDLIGRINDAAAPVTPTPSYRPFGDTYGEPSERESDL